MGLCDGRPFWRVSFISPTFETTNYLDVVLAVRMLVMVARRNSYSGIPLLEILDAGSWHERGANDEAIFKWSSNCGGPFIPKVIPMSFI